MRRRLRKRLHSSFDQALRSELPEFTRRKDIRVPPGSKVYSKTEGGATFFIVLEVNDDWDSFNVSLAFNLQGEEFVRFAGLLPTDESVNGKLRFPLYRLWDSDPRANPWYWEICRLPDPLNPLAEEPEEELLPKVDVLVAQAVERIVHFGLPYFDSVLEASSPD